MEKTGDTEGLVGAGEMASSCFVHSAAAVRACFWPAHMQRQHPGVKIKSLYLPRGAILAMVRSDQVGF